MPYASGTVTITVDYGYDIHSLVFSGRSFRRVQSGKPLTFKGQGFHWEDEPDQDYWRFNGTVQHPSPGAIHVFTRGGGDIYSGEMDDEEVYVQQEPCEARVGTL